MVANRNGPGARDVDCGLTLSQGLKVMEDNKDMVEVGHLGRFEPPTETDEIIYLLNEDRPLQAAQRLAKLEFCDQVLLCAIADLIGGDINLNPELAETYLHRLALVGGNRPGPKPKSLQIGLKTESNLDPVGSETDRVDHALVAETSKIACNLGPDKTDEHSDLPDTLSQSKASTTSEDIIALLTSGSTAEAAHGMRQLKCGNQALLQTLADMIGRGAEGHAEVASTYSSRLVLQSWGIKGRKPLSSKAKPKGHPFYKPKNTRLDLHRAAQNRQMKDGTIGDAEISIQSSRSRKVFLVQMVMRRMARGMSCPKAVREVAKAHFLSYGWVKTAYNTLNKLVKFVGSRPPPPPKTNSTGI